MAETQRAGTIVSLTDSTLSVADPAEDVRGHDVIDRHGEKVGRVDDLMIDEQEGRVRFLRVAHGGVLGIGASHFLVPVDAVTRVDDAHVHINRAHQDLSGVPGYDPTLAEVPDYYPGLYGWWGYNPYWTEGYVAPRYPGSYP
jgi:sporulation protein YlmC with PRC-barrel domain